MSENKVRQSYYVKRGNQRWMVTEHTSILTGGVNKSVWKLWRSINIYSNICRKGRHQDRKHHNENGFRWYQHRKSSILTMMYDTEYKMICLNIKPIQISFTAPKKKITRITECTICLMSCAINMVLEIINLRIWNKVETAKKKKWFYWRERHIVSSFFFLSIQGRLVMLNLPN